MTCYLKLM